MPYICRLCISGCMEQGPNIYWALIPRRYRRICLSLYSTGLPTSAMDERSGNEAFNTQNKDTIMQTETWVYVGVTIGKGIPYHAIPYHYVGKCKTTKLWKGILKFIMVQCRWCGPQAMVPATCNLSDQRFYKKESSLSYFLMFCYAILG